MPPKAKFTKDEIVNAALNITKTEGFQALTARALGTKHLWIYTHGIAVLCATKMCRFTGKEIEEMISEVFLSLLKKLKEGENND